MCSYDGDWVAGVKHGQGELRITDGSVYVGQFVNGEMQGQVRVALDCIVFL